MNFLIVEPSPLPILNSLGPKYSPQDPVLKYKDGSYKIEVLGISSWITFLDLKRSEDIRSQLYMYTYYDLHS